MIPSSPEQLHHPVQKITTEESLGRVHYLMVFSDAGVAGVSDEGTSNGVYGRSQNANGVVGYSSSKDNNGVAGVNLNGGNGVLGHSPNGGIGVFGLSEQQAGVYGESKGFNGVLGQTTADGHAGVAGVSDSGNSNGVYGRSQNANGVVGYSSSKDNNGVAGVNHNGGNGVLGHSPSGIGVFGLSDTGMAGYFEGSITVTNDIILKNADCAENFDIAGLEKVEPGTVMVIDSEGALRPSDQPYDKRVAGVISGAGLYKPGLILDKQESSKNRMPIALMGKVYCKVDASYGAIEVGDLLTTSPTPGHAMKADDPMKAFGSVIGKALQPLAIGEGLIPILIALQ
jgi:hypothetical protein